MGSGGGNICRLFFTLVETAKLDLPIWILPILLGIAMRVLFFGKGVLPSVSATNDQTLSTGRWERRLCWIFVGDSNAWSSDSEPRPHIGSALKYTPAVVLRTRLTPAGDPSSVRRHVTSLDQYTSFSLKRPWRQRLSLVTDVVLETLLLCRLWSVGVERRGIQQGPQSWRTVL